MMRSPIVIALILLAAPGSFLHLPAADPPSPAGASGSPASPPAKPREGRDKRHHRPGGADREEWEKRREELRHLSPEQRRAKIREWRRQRVANRPEVKDLTPEERQGMRKEFRDYLTEEIAELENQKQQRGLKEHESRRLVRLKEIMRRFDDPPPGDKPPGVVSPTP